jgi:hypothetical protein
MTLSGRADHLRRKVDADSDVGAHRSQQVAGPGSDLENALTRGNQPTVQIVETPVVAAIPAIDAIERMRHEVPVRDPRITKHFALTVTGGRGAMNGRRFGVTLVRRSQHVGSREYCRTTELSMHRNVLQGGVLRFAANVRHCWRSVVDGSTGL